MHQIQITCHFCFESFETQLEVAPTFNGQDFDVIDCTVCCHPNTIHYTAFDGQITITEVSDGNG